MKHEQHHREPIDIEKFRIVHAIPIRTRLQRDKYEVELSFSGPMDHNGKTLPVNAAIWRGILRAARIDHDTVYFDKSFAKQVVANLRRLTKPPFEDEEAMTALAKVIDFLSQGRPVCVSGPRFAN